MTSLLSYSSGHNSMTLNLIATSTPLPVAVTCHHHHHHTLSSPISMDIPSEPVRLILIYLDDIIKAYPRLQNGPQLL